jgi:hypothetical protein
MGNTTEDVYQFGVPERFVAICDYGLFDIVSECFPFLSRFFCLLVPDFPEFPSYS